MVTSLKNIYIKQQKGLISVEFINLPNNDFRDSVYYNINDFFD